MPPLVSILIPCYNSEKWLGETLKSATTQTWKNVEVIVVDDGSNDGSLEIARSFQAKNVKIISQENQGPSVARNRAYSEAQGSFIQHLDADDLLSPEKIEAQVILLQDCEPEMLGVSATVNFFDGTHPSAGVLHDGWPMVDTDDPPTWLIDMLGPERGGMVQPGAWLTPRSIAERIGPWNSYIDPSPDNDGEYFARAVLASTGIRKSPSGANYYRQFRKATSMSGQNSEVYQWGSIRSLDLIKEHLLKRADNVRARRALARRYMDRAFVSYPIAPRVTKAALERVAELGGTTYQPRFGTPRGEFLASLFGWKATRYANHVFHQTRSRLRNSISSRGRTG